MSQVLHDDLENANKDYSEKTNRLLDTDEGDDKFHSAFGSQVQLIATGSGGGAGPETFDTHSVDNKFAEMQLNTNLVEEAKQLAQQKADNANITASQIRNQ